MSTRGLGFRAIAKSRGALKLAAVGEGETECRTIDSHRAIPARLQISGGNGVSRTTRNSIRLSNFAFRAALRTRRAFSRIKNSRRFCRRAHSAARVNNAIESFASLNYGGNACAENKTFVIMADHNLLVFVAITVNF